MSQVAERHRAGNLPAELTSFVGRDAELAAVIRLLESSRLVTLTGVGGVGKTRLALQAAALQPLDAADQAWLVELSALQDAELLENTVASVLGVADQTSVPQLTVLTDYLRPRRLLLILDTCEHLLPACAELVRALLRAAPGLRILATSRQALGVPGETQLTVPPLPTPGPRAAEEAIARSESVILFVERALAVDAGFSLNPDNHQDVSRLCRMLDGVPLALELAAGRLHGLSLGQIMDRLDDRFALLRAKTGSPLPRHQTLRGAIGWSHELCTPAERLLWARLAVFAGEFELAAAEDVCSDDRLQHDRIADLLCGLVDKSIALRKGDRFRLLDTVREYGLDWLRELGAETEVRRRHRDYYLDLARRGEAEWCGPDQLGWCRRIRRQFPDLRAALDFCFATPAEHETGIEFAGRLWFAWWGCGFVRDGRHYLDRALARGTALSAARTRAVWARGMVALVQGDAVMTVALGEELTALSVARRDANGQAFAAYLRGVGAVIQGDVERGTALFREAAAAHARGGAPIGVALALASLTTAYTLRGEFDQAIATHEEQCALCWEHGEVWARSYGDFARAMAELGRGRIDTAVRFARTSLDIKYRLHDRVGIALNLDLLAASAGAGGQPDRAARLLGAAERVWRDFGLPGMGLSAFAAARRVTEQEARTRLGEHAFEKAYSAGRTLDTDEAVAYAQEG